MSSEYEAMRAQMTGGTACTTPLGLTLFIRRGLTSWLKTCSSLQSAAVTTDARPHSDAPLSLTPSLELASLLADMAMKCGRLCHAF